MKTGVLHAGVAQVVEELDAVDPEHGRQRVGMASPAVLGVDGTYSVLHALPRNQGIHTLQEQFTAGLAFLALVFQISKGGLVHTTSLPASVRLFGLTMPHRRRLVQGFPRVRSTTHRRGRISKEWLSGLLRTTVSSQSPGHQPAGVGPVGPVDLEPGESSQQLGQHQLSSIPVLDVSGVHHHCQEQPGGVVYDVALASGYLLACVIAERPRFSVVRTDWLSMMAAPSASSGGCCMPSHGLPNHGAQCLLHPLPDALGPPFPEIPPDRAPRGQVVGHHSPGYSATQHVQYAVYHLPQIGNPGMSPGCIRG